jgi:hypothetical protein
MPDILNWVAVTLTILTATGLLLSRDWRWGLGILAVQYVSVFWLVYLHWPIGMAAVKLITGWMACAMLGMSQVGSSVIASVETSWPEGRLFRSFVAGLILLAVASIAPALTNWLGIIEVTASWGGLILIGMGLLVIIALLTVLSGFEILYASIENSVLVASLLAVVTLGLALAGAYLLSISTPEKSQ